MRRALGGILAIGLSACSSARPEATPPHSPVPGLDIPAGSSLAEALDWVDRAAAGSEEKIDVLLASMVMARVLFPEVDIPRDLAAIDALAYEARTRGGATADSIGRVFRDKGFTYVDQDIQSLDPRWKQNYTWAHQVLATRRGQCNGLSLLYLGLGERLGLPVAAAILPNHVLVRCSAFNIESTLNGRLVDDAHYLERFKVAPRVVTRKSYLAVLLSNHLGYALTERKRYDDALRCFDLAIRLFPDYSDVWVNRGVALRALGRAKEALESYDRALAIQPEDVLAWNNRGNALDDLGRPSEAQESFAKARGLDPAYALAGANAADSLLKAGRAEEALALAKARLEVAPNDLGALTTAGTALGNLGRDEEAVAFYDKALKLDPDRAIVWSNRANSLVRLGRTDEAVAGYDRALDLDPKFAGAWANLGVLHARDRREDEALRCFAKAIEADPKHPRAWENRGGLRIGRREYASAIQDLDEALRLVPASIHARLLRAEALTGAGRLDEAEADFSKVIESRPSGSEAFVQRSRVRRLKKDLPSAEKDAVRAVELSPASVEARIETILVASAADRLKAALDRSDSLVRDKPDLARAWGLRGDVRARLEDLEGAAGDYARASELDPNDPTYFSNRSVLFARLGRNEEALQAAAAALAIDPEKPYYAFAARGLVALNQGRRVDALKDFLLFESKAEPEDRLRARVREWKLKARE